MSNFYAALRGLAFCLVLAGLFVPTTSRAQDVCNSERARGAETEYQRANFAEVKLLLRDCVPDGFTLDVDRIAALRLMALSYLAEDSVEAARSYVRLLLKEDTGYRARQEIDPPRLVNLVNDERPPWIAWLWQGGSIPRWLGRAAIVGVAVSVPLLLQPEAPPSPLPGPPTLPAN